MRLVSIRIEVFGVRGARTLKSESVLVYRCHCSICLHVSSLKCHPRPLQLPRGTEPTQATQTVVESDQSAIFVLRLFTHSIKTFRSTLESYSFSFSFSLFLPLFLHIVTR